MLLKQAEIGSPLSLYYVGPDLEEGPLPSYLYLALSAEESLLVDPFNQPVAALQRSKCRVFSTNLPSHGKGLAAVDGIKRWAESFDRGENILGDFLDKLEISLQILFATTGISSMGVLGLSRGGLIACHIAARCLEISHILNFAPLTRLDLNKECSHLASSPLIRALDLSLLHKHLYKKKIRTYIGNRDLRVGTSECFAWMQALVEEAFLQQIKSPPIELFIKPSIGLLGHGTPKESFEEGAFWLLKEFS